MKRNIVIAAVAAAALIAGGATSAVAAIGEDDVTSATNVTQAIDASLGAVPGTVSSAELDDDNTWDVDVLGKDGKWHDVTVHAGSGTVRGTHVDDDDDAVTTARTDAKEAAAAATRSVPGTVTSVDLDDDGEARAWEVDVQSKDGREHELKVDVNSAKATADHVVTDDSDDDSDDGSDEGSGSHSDE
ncbi:PepSY domain-containing protein [Streptomyces sp. NPDC002851]